MKSGTLVPKEASWGDCFFSFSDGDTRNLMDEVSLVQLSVDTFLLEI